jgi:hypothetical protein
MKRLLSIVALLGLSGLGIAQTPAQTPSATDSQATPSAQTPSTSNPNSSMPQTQTDATSAQQSARAFEGKIAKSGDQLVLKDSATQTSYKLDDQAKAKQFEGKSVKVMATVDAATNTLHVVDISASESR